MNKFDCTKCTHQNVCRYKEQIPEFDSKEGSDSVFELALTCKEYREMLTIPKISGDPVVVPYDRSWSSIPSEITLLGSTGSKETECMAYRSYIERAKDSNYIGDSPCSYCLKTSCPHSQLITCSNESTATSIK